MAFPGRHGGCTEPAGLVGFPGFRGGRFHVIHGRGGAARRFGASGSATSGSICFFLTLSGALVFFPYLSYGLLQRLGRVGGHLQPHRGPLGHGPRGRPAHVLDLPADGASSPGSAAATRSSTYLPLVVIPTLVILGSMYAFIVLLTGFFLWASIHVTHQAQYISETYRMRAGAPVRALDRWLDGGVILGALYTMAMYKFVEDRFALGSSVLLFPEFLKHRWVADRVHRRLRGVLPLLRRPRLRRDPPRRDQLAAPALHDHDRRDGVRGPDLRQPRRLVPGLQHLALPAVPGADVVHPGPRGGDGPDRERASCRAARRQGEDAAASTSR